MCVKVEAPPSTFSKVDIKTLPSSGDASSPRCRPCSCCEASQPSIWATTRVGSPHFRAKVVAGEAPSSEPCCAAGAQSQGAVSGHALLGSRGRVASEQGDQHVGDSGKQSQRDAPHKER